MQLGPSSTVARLATCCTSGNSLENAADQTLCRRWRDRHDISAAHQLAKRHRRLVLELAEIYRPSGLAWDDLTGEGQLGLMHAICRFDPDQGVRFATYATWCVTVSLHQYVLKNAPRAFVRARVGDNYRRSDEVGHQPTARVEAVPGIAA
jgi:RNA polymerase sigma-32 factor